jgi:hypothetical protein
MDNYSPLSSYRRKELLCEYKKIVKSTKYFTSDFLDRESSLTSHKYFPVIQTKGKTRLLQHEDISYQDIRSFFSNSKSIELNKPPLINVSIPIYVTPKHGFFDLPLDFLERVEPQNLEGYKRTFQTRNVNEIKQLLLSQHFQCTYNGNDYFLVGIDRNKYLLQFSLNQTTRGNSIINDELYITSASIKSFIGDESPIITEIVHENPITLNRGLECQHFLIPRLFSI